MEEPGFDKGDAAFTLELSGHDGKRRHRDLGAKTDGIAGAHERLFSMWSGSSERIADQA